MSSQFLASRSTRLALVSLLLMALPAIACSLVPAGIVRPTQATLATQPAYYEDWPTPPPPIPSNMPAAPTPQSAPQGPADTGAAIDPCKLVTTTEVTSLLGSAPAPHLSHAYPGDNGCDFQVMTGLLSVNAASNPQAAAEFQMASSSFKQNAGYKSAQLHGVSLAVVGSANADGNGTPGFTAFLNRGDILVTIRLYSKTYTYSPDKAVALLETIGGRIP